MHTDYTPEDLADYAAYEAVRAAGRYNMLAYQARELTGLSIERYSFVMNHFSQLRELYLLELEL